MLSFMKAVAMLGCLRSLEINGVKTMRQIIRQAPPEHPAFLPSTFR